MGAPHGDSLFASHLLPGISQAASGSLSLKPFVIPCCCSPPTSHITVTFVSSMMSWLAWVSNHLLRRFEKQIVIPHASITPHTPPPPKKVVGLRACQPPQMDHKGPPNPTAVTIFPLGSASVGLQQCLLLPCE